MLEDFFSILWPILIFIGGYVVGYVISIVWIVFRFNDNRNKNLPCPLCKQLVRDEKQLNTNQMIEKEVRHEKS